MIPDPALRRKPAIERVFRRMAVSNRVLKRLKQPGRHRGTTTVTESKSIRAKPKNRAFGRDKREERTGLRGRGIEISNKMSFSLWVDICIEN